MRRRVAIGLVIVLAVLAWWTVRRLPVRTVDRPATSVPVPMLAPASVRLEPAAAPTDHAVAEHAVKEAAIAALAAASGRYAVVCPPLQDDDSTATTWAQPVGATCATTRGLVCAISEPAGTVVIWRDEEPQDPVAVYRWDTDADGATNCVSELPTETHVRLHVLDGQGVPSVGAWVSTTEIGRRGAITDSDGWATLPLVHNGTNWVFAVSDGAVSSPVGVAAGGVATIVLGDPPEDVNPGAEILEVRMARLVEAIEDLEMALETSTTPEVAGELGELLDNQVRILDGVCGQSIADVPTCRAWKARH